MRRRHAETSQKAMSEFSRLFGSDTAVEPMVVDEGGQRSKKKEKKE